MVLLGVELLGVALDGDTTFTFLLARVEVVGETEGRFTFLVGHGLELLHLTGGDTTHLKDEVTARRGFSGIDVSAHDEGEVDLVRHLDVVRLSGFGGVVGWVFCLLLRQEK
jgi:hypothetical protein